MEVSPVLCLDCGECIRVCQYDAVRARMSRPSDLKRLKYTVAVPSMTLYTQFGKDVCPSQVAAAIRHVGFGTQYESSPVSPMVSRAIDTYLSECQGPWPKISVRKSSRPWRD